MQKDRDIIMANMNFMPLFVENVEFCDTLGGRGCLAP
jgi:hypothetical protein